MNKIKHIQQIEYNTNISNYGQNYHNPTCPQCSSANLSTDTGLKLEQITLRYGKCLAFIEYRDLEKLQRLRRRKLLTPCFELLEKQGLTGDVAIFILSVVGDES